jgi:ribokinase
MTVVVVGDVMVDVVARHDGPLAHGSDTPASVQLRPGGAGGNVAAWLTHAGAEVALVACVGTDAFAEIGLRGLRADHVRRHAEVPTGVCVVLVDGEAERTMLPDAGANLALPYVAAELLVPGNVLYVSGYTLLRPQTRRTAQAALETARENGVRTVVDCASAGPLRAAPDFLEWVGTVDLLLANAREAEILGRRAYGMARELVVKHGRDGASWDDGEREVSVRAAPAEVVDTTGAGDAFAAGFVSAWPGPPERALGRGAALAAEAVGVIGGRPVIGGPELV